MQDKIATRIAESIAAKQQIPTQTLEAVAIQMADALRHGHKLIFAGNGGSAADAQHITAEFTGRFLIERRPLPAIALATNGSALTAIANDYGFDSVFARQLEAVGQPGDIFVPISTSGNSQNLITAIETAKKIGIQTIGVLGKDGGKMKAMVDTDITIEHPDTPRIQEAHILCLHILCELIDDQLFGDA